MKKLLMVLCIFAGIISCRTADKKAGSSTAGGPTTIEWLDSTNQNLGEVKEGEVVEVTYRFKNSGDNDLIIENVQTTCGCTVAEKPEKPIAPGKEEVIRAKFDSRGKVGPNSKPITVTANIPDKQTTLHFNVNVVK
jgi:hypothetical protein